MKTGITGITLVQAHLTQEQPDIPQRITYSRDMLLMYRNSPLAQGFPLQAKIIPGIIEPPKSIEPQKNMHNLTK